MVLAELKQGDRKKWVEQKEWCKESKEVEWIKKKSW